MAQANSSFNQAMAAIRHKRAPIKTAQLACEAKRAYLSIATLTSTYIGKDANKRRRLNAIYQTTQKLIPIAETIPPLASYYWALENYAKNPVNLNSYGVQLLETALVQFSNASQDFTELHSHAFRSRTGRSLREEWITALFNSWTGTAKVLGDHFFEKGAASVNRGLHGYYDTRERLVQEALTAWSYALRHYNSVPDIQSKAGSAGASLPLETAEGLRAELTSRVKEIHDRAGQLTASISRPEFLQQYLKA